MLNWRQRKLFLQGGKNPPLLCKCLCRTARTMEKTFPQGSRGVEVGFSSFALFSDTTFPPSKLILLFETTTRSLYRLNPRLWCLLVELNCFRALIKNSWLRKFETVPVSKSENRKFAASFSRAFIFNSFEKGFLFL